MTADDAEDDEDAIIEGWLEKRNDRKAFSWFWQRRFFRLEPGPRLLSFYISHMWQGCRRDGAFDMTCLTGAHIKRRNTSKSVSMMLEFSNTSAEAYSVLEGVETVELRVPDGLVVARAWERLLLNCIEYTLLDACMRCKDYNGLTDTALRILVRAQVAAADDSPCIDVDRVREVGTGHTAMMLAAHAGNEQLVTHFMMAKADPQLQDKQGQTAMDLAVAAGHAKIDTLLAAGTISAVPSPTILGAIEFLDDAESPKELDDPKAKN